MIKCEDCENTMRSDKIRIHKCKPSHKFPSKEKKPCPECRKPISVNNISRHLQTVHHIRRENGRPSAGRIFVAKATNDDSDPTPIIDEDVIIKKKAKRVKTARRIAPPKTTFKNRAKKPRTKAAPARKFPVIHVEKCRIFDCDE